MVWTWLAAFSPIGLLMVLLICFHQPAFKASFIAMLFSALFAVFLFRSDGTLLLFETLKGVWNALSIIAVVLTAIFMYELTEETKVFTHVKGMLQTITKNEFWQIIGISMVFSSFLQGATGFGVPILVSAPLLVSLGVKPLYAVVICLLGHSWAGTFGTLAIAWLALVNETGISGELLLQTAQKSSLFLLCLNCMNGFFITWMYGKSKALKKFCVPIFVLSLIQGGGQYLFCGKNPILACFIPSAFALFAFVIIGRYTSFHELWLMKDSALMDRKHEVGEQNQQPSENAMTIFFPYLVLTICTLIFLTNEQLKTWLSSISFGFSFPSTQTGLGFINNSYEKYSPFAPFIHSSFYLLISGMLSYWYYKSKGLINKGKFLNICKKTIQRSFFPSLSILNLMILSKIMAGSGQVEVLALGASKALQQNYFLISPLIGTLGAFITSSNMSSNILLSEFQYRMSNLLFVSPAYLLSAQTLGASIGTSIAPSNIALGAATTNMQGKEGKILGVILPIATACALLFGLLLMLLLSGGMV